GGLELVQKGGFAANTFLSGGFMLVQSGGLLGNITFSADRGGTLELDDSQHFGNGTIIGFASPAGVTEAIDLRDITFDGTTTVKYTEAASNTSGTLTVTHGTQTANLTLLGTYSTASFHIATDNAGGTLVTDPTVVGSAGNPTLAAHA